MNVQTDWKKVTVFLRKLRFPLLVLSLGVILMLLPRESRALPEPEAAREESLLLDTAALEALLSQVQGAGHVRLYLSLQAGQTVNFQTDSTTREDRQGDSVSRSEDTQTVLSSGSSGLRQPLIRSTDAPQYRGAVIVCQGARDAAVRLSLTQALASLTGLRSDQIVIMKMK